MSKRKRTRAILIVLTFVVLGALAWAAIASQLSTAPAHANSYQKKPATEQKHSTSTALPPGLVQTPEGHTYTPAKAEPVSAIVSRFLPQTTYMTRSELDAALREQNKLGKALFLKKDQTIVVPGVEPQPVVENRIPVPPEYEVRAIYLTGAMSAGDHGIQLVRRWREAGGNAVVFDIKDSDGIVNIAFEHPLAQPHRPAIQNLPKYVRFLHQQGMHAIARIALFRDEQLVTHHPELAVQSRRAHQAWRENGKLVWTDTSNPKVQQYNLELARQVAAAGVDEVQFDYVRFPAEGDQKDAQFTFEAGVGCKQGKEPDAKPCGPQTRPEVIAGFLKDAYEQLHAQGALLSLDVFGVMAWQRPVDLSHTGQDIQQMARHCDVLSPMIYPSHFFGMDGYAAPGDAPEHFISESMQRFAKITADTDVVLRPWLQAFSWRTKTYSADYIKVQMATSHANHGDGFLFWNARNDYGKPLVAMAGLKTDHAQYFRGDELTDTPRLFAEHDKTVAEHAEQRQARKAHPDAPAPEHPQTKPSGRSRRSM